MCNSLSQSFDCLTYGVIEVVFTLPVKSPVESGTDVGARQPKFDVIHPVDHRVLGAFQSVLDQQKSRILTLIIASRTLTEPKTALAGVLPEISFARLKASMNPFSVEMTPSRSLGRWDPVSMNETRGRRKRFV